MQSQLTIRLPYKIFVTDGESFISGYDSWDFKITFHQWDLAITGIGWLGEAFPVTVVTIVASTGVHGEIDGHVPDKIVRDFFLGSLAYLNRVIDSYRINAQDYTVRNVWLGDLPPIIDIKVGDNWYSYMVNVPHWIIASAKQDKTEAMISMGKTLSSWGHWPQLMVSRRFYASARYHFEQGNNFNAIIDLETAFEIQVRLTFGMILTDLGVPESDRQNLLKTPLRNVIEDHFAKHLGGNFSYTKPGAINDWYQHLYLLRNKCLHEGNFDVTGGEAISAFNTYHEVQNYIAQKLIDKGLLESDGSIFLPKYIPQREVEEYEEVIRERLIKSGLLPDDQGYTRHQEIPEEPQDLPGNVS